MLRFLLVGIFNLCATFMISNFPFIYSQQISESLSIRMHYIHLGYFQTKNISYISDPNYSCFSFDNETYNCILDSMFDYDKHDSY